METEMEAKLSSQWEAKAKATFTHIAQPFKVRPLPNAGQNV